MNLDELKKKLLAALPPAIREKLGVELDEDLEEDDQEDIDSDEATDSHDLDEMKEANQSSGDDDDEDAEDDEEEDEEALAKAKKSKIIRIIVMCAIAFFVLDEFMSEPQTGGEGDVPAIATPELSPARQAMLLEKQRLEEEAKKAQQEAASTDQETQIPSEPEVANTPEVIETPTTFNEESSAPENIDSTSLAQENELNDQAQEQVKEEIPPETPAVVLTPAQEVPVIVVPTPNFELGSDDIESETKKESSLDMLMKAVDKSEKISETQVKNATGRDDPSYIEPPNYLRSGRGLVYNCKENHWACVDKFSYFTCYENQNWNKENDQSTECITRDVYASAADCAAIQKYYVNKPEPTDFCGKKDSGSKAVNTESNTQEQEDITNLVAP